MIEIISKKMVITRKTHKCYACTEEIEKGKSAVYVIAKQDEERIRCYLHKGCNKKVVQKMKFSGIGLAFGCLKEAENLNIEIYPDEEYPFFMMKFNTNNQNKG